MSAAKTPDSQLTATAKYKKANMTYIPIRLNRRTESDIIRRLYEEISEPVQTYIKRLIRADMERRRGF